MGIKTPTENKIIVTIVIPHIGQSDILYACLRSLKNEKKVPFRVLIIDNGSDLSAEKVSAILPTSDFEIVKNEQNLGFAGGCNVGLRRVETPYAVLLNNDTEVGENWLEPLVACMEDYPNAAACQPKILSMRFPGKFDYAGGMGGLIDRFGYPFAIGRIFDALETDTGQYEGRFRIFWASGTAIMIRTAVLSQSGLLDEDFFAHMEEIDLNWRFHLLGYSVLSDSKSQVYHYSGYSLGHEAHRKMYLNHRNNWMMLLKNYSFKTLVWLIPVRLVFEGLTFWVSVAKLDVKRAWAVLRAGAFILVHGIKIRRKHRDVQSIRNVSDEMIFSQMYRGSIVFDYFVRGVRRVCDLEGLPTWIE
ncbi:MAG: glycosyltransferase family 2 protein [Calditrichaeota bacterium]|nr:glycosyltransferase family 2 protein [Calditrichota bacterium]